MRDRCGCKYFGLRRSIGCPAIYSYRSIPSKFNHVLCQGKGCDEDIQYDRLPTVHRSVRSYGDGRIWRDFCLRTTDVCEVKNMSVRPCPGTLSVSGDIAVFRDKAGHVETFKV